jgi:hypothetical protein
MALRDQATLVKGIVFDLDMLLTKKDQDDRVPILENNMQSDILLAHIPC